MNDEEPVNDGDLWGPDFVGNDAQPVLVTLLEEQANALTRRTDGRIEGVVSQDPTAEGTVWTSLYASVPALGDYRHKLLTIVHPVTADPADPFPLTVHDPVRGSQGVADLPAFCRWLRRTLSSQDVHGVINNLLRYGDDRVAS